MGVTLGWMLVTFLTKPTDEATLRRFRELVRPGGPGWATVRHRAAASGQRFEQASQRWNVPMEIVCMMIGCMAVYSALIATGYWIYRDYGLAVALTAVAAGCTVMLILVWRQVNTA